MKQVELSEKAQQLVNTLRQYSSTIQADIHDAITMADSEAQFIDQADHMLDCIKDECDAFREKLNELEPERHPPTPRAPIHSESFECWLHGVRSRLGGSLKPFDDVALDIDHSSPDYHKFYWETSRIWLDLVGFTLNDLDKFCEVGVSVDAMTWVLLAKFLVREIIKQKQ